MGKKRNFIPKQNTYDLLVGTLSIGIPSYWFKSVAREIRAKRFEILLKHLHSECNQDLIFFISNVGKGCDPSSL